MTQNTKNNQSDQDTVFEKNEFFDVIQPDRATLFVKRMFGHKTFIFSAILLLIIIVSAVFAPLIAPHNPFEHNLNKRMIPPVWSEKGTLNNIFGTDFQGRDFLSRMIYGARVSLLIGIIAMLISGVIGTLLGIFAGYFGGWVDSTITFILTTRLSLPLMMVALALVSVIGGSLETVTLIIGCLIWQRFLVVMRSATMQIRDLDYIKAARAIGCSKLYIIFTEIMPNMAANIIVVASFEVAHAVLLEAGLSFLGLGVQPPVPSWGLLIAEGREQLMFNPHLVMIPGIAISMLVLSINLLGDGIRDILAPEQRN